MKRPTVLYQALLAQASLELGMSTERDRATILGRFEHEGLSFLTITLPKLSDCLESGLESGLLSLPLGFKRGRGRLPALLQGFFSRVFSKDGLLLEDPCVESIRWIRQIARFYKKPKLSCTPEREFEAEQKFLKVEEELAHATLDVNRCDDLLDRVSAVLWSSVFPTVDQEEFICGHGPGATGERRSPNQRRRILEWYTRFDGVFELADHASLNYEGAWDAPPGTTAKAPYSWIKFHDIRDEPPVRVVFVPKTMQAPRVIAIEPSAMMFVQQGVTRWMTSRLETHRLTSGSVNFTDQTINKKLAQRSSIDRRLATIDLSDASDRVHNDLVNRVFRRSPLLEYLQAARSLHATLPSGTNVILKKYASMGSALCFPVEACIFYTLVLTAIHAVKGWNPTYRSIQRLKDVVKVYGDDIICPVEYVDTVISYLESYALRVNRRKSFARSAFRESCGGDFYNGVSVKPVYARMDLPQSKRDWTPNHLLSWTATANLFYEEGMWIVAQAIRDMVSSVCSKPIPISQDVSHGLAYKSAFQNRALRYNRNLCSYEQKRLVFQPTYKKDDIHDDYTAQLLCLLGEKRATLPSNDRASSRLQHLEDHGSFEWSHPTDLARIALRLCGAASGLRHLAEETYPNGHWTQLEEHYPNSDHDSRLVHLFGGRTRNSLGRDSCSATRSSEELGLLFSSLREERGAFDPIQSVKRGTFKPKYRWVSIVS